MSVRSPDLMLEMQRVLPAPLEAVVAAFTEPERMASWWGPEGFTAPDLDFDPRVGERYRIEMQPPEGDPFRLTGQFSAVDLPHRLAFTFVWEPPDADDVETTVDLSFHALGESTELSLTQGPFTTEQRRALHRDGWAESFDKLERRIS